MAPAGAPYVSSEAMRRPSTAAVLAVVLAVAACRQTAERAPADTKPPAGEPGETSPPTAAPCETLDRAECLRVRHCTLHFVKDGQYECRAEAGPCETDLFQGDKAGCEAREGCVWEPGSCYCPFPGYGTTQVADKSKDQGGACACGGGPPPMCKAAARVEPQR
jgi:hypothetical protein